MKEIDFFRRLGNIDDELITAADRVNIHKKKSILKYGLLAASFAVVILCSMLFLTEDGKTPYSPDATLNTQENAQSSSQTTAEYKYELHYNSTDKAIGTYIRIPGHFWQELSESEKVGIFGELTEKYNISATANFSKEDEKISIFDISADIAIREDFSVMLKTSPAGIVMCYVLDTDNIKETVINGVSVSAGRFDKTNDGKVIYFASFKIGETHYYAEGRCDEADENIFSKLIYDIIESGEADFSVLDPIAPELRDDNLTLSQAYADEKFGAYIPENIPSGYSFEESHRFINQKYDYLSVLWCRNYDDISFRVSQITEQEKKLITDTGETKNYDLSLYPIPRAESVPEELWEIVDNPIFRIEDLTLEAVEKRVTVYETEGYETKNIINFGVLYDEKYLVSVSASGISPTELYDILKDMEK